MMPLKAEKSKHMKPPWLLLATQRDDYIVVA